MLNRMRSRTALIRHSLLVLSGLILAVLGTSAPAAAAAPRGGCEMVHVGPEIARGAPPASYFKLTIKPGEIAHVTLVAGNPQSYSCGVEVLPAYGKTATNSGDTYSVLS